ncbi:Uncharacterized conserved protein [Nocardia africana]|uniref:Uncharacterized conserved protein n=1 Tax=Nocardia africana TaxID=134964 RepID=A0A378WQX6_9NOCA|nr:Uncharacterized conserved protein [Nocardia africana]
MVERAYPEALKIYRQRKVDPDGPDRPEWIEFRERHCIYPVPITFLGVFDTVGALGVPLLTSWRYRFHDVRLSRNVRYARQALAIDERRRMYAPCLWEITDDPEGGPSGADRVRQVWFEGVHTDIGGGYADSRLSDITLRWMVEQARTAGLSFDDERIEQLLNRRTPVQSAATPDSAVAAPDSPPQPHDSLTVFYRVLNRVGWALHPRNPRFYADSWRRLSAPVIGGSTSPTAPRRARPTAHRTSSAGPRNWQDHCPPCRSVRATGAAAPISPGPTGCRGPSAISP